MAKSKGKSRRSIGTPTTPINILGSKKSTPSKVSNTQSKRAQLHGSTGSDSGLLLTKRKPFGITRRLDSLDSNNRRALRSASQSSDDEEVWGATPLKDPIPLGIYTIKSDTTGHVTSRTNGKSYMLGDNDESAMFSDDGFNDLKLPRKKILDIADSDWNTDLSNYKSIVVPLEKITFGEDVERAVIDNGPIKLKTSIDSDILQFQQEKHTMDVDISKVETVYYSDTNFHLKLNGNAKWLGHSHRHIQLQLSHNNNLKLKRLWEMICKEHGKEPNIEQMSRNDISALVRKHEVAGFANKKMGSLKKLPNPRSSSSTPQKITSNRNSSSLPASTPVHKFYSPVLNRVQLKTPQIIPAPGADRGGTGDSSLLSQTQRVTRSSSRNDPSNPHIVIEDTFTPVKQQRTKEAPFIPALKYNFRDTVFCIKDSDYKCLGPRQWVNDTLIDFFMKYFTEEMEKADLDPLEKDSYHVFSTFFFTKLTSTKKYYDNIKRWLSKIDFGSKEFAIIPINESLHWYGCIVNNIKGLLTEDEICTVFVFDSLNQQHADVLLPIRSFLVDYFQDRHQLTIDPARIQYHAAKVQRQPNFNDCGIHVIYNISKFLSNRVQCVELWSKDQSRKVPINVLFKSKEVLNWRGKLKATLKRLQEQMMEEENYVPEDVSGNEAVQDDDSDDEVMYIDPEEFQKYESTKLSLKNGPNIGLVSNPKEGSANPEESSDTAEASPDEDPYKVGDKEKSVVPTATGVSDANIDFKTDETVKDLVFGMRSLETQDSESIINSPLLSLDMDEDDGTATGIGNGKGEEDGDDTDDPTPVLASPDGRGDDHTKTTIIESSDVESSLESTDGRAFPEAPFLSDTEANQTHNLQPVLQVQASQEYGESQTESKLSQLDEPLVVLPLGGYSCQANIENAGSTPVRSVRFSFDNEAHEHRVLNDNDRIGSEDDSLAMNGKKESDAIDSDILAMESMSPVKHQAVPKATEEPPNTNDTGTCEETDADVLSIDSEEDEKKLNPRNKDEEEPQSRRIKRRRVQFEVPENELSDDEEDVVELNWDSDDDRPPLKQKAGANGVNIMIPKGPTTPASPSTGKKWKKKKHKKKASKFGSTPESN